MHKSILLSAAAFFMAAAGTAEAQIPENMPAKDAPNYRLAHPGLAVAGQPSAQMLSQLKALGFRTVINLRTLAEDEIVAAEEKEVTSQGLKYLSVPVTPETLSAADVAAVRRLLDDDMAAPVLFHCSTANRVGAVLAAIEVERGRSLDEAEAYGKTMGLKSPPMVEAFRRVAKPAR